MGKDRLIRALCASLAIHAVFLNTRSLFSSHGQKTGAVPDRQAQSVRLEVVVVQANGPASTALPAASTVDARSRYKRHGQLLKATEIGRAPSPVSRVLPGGLKTIKSQPQGGQELATTDVDVNVAPGVGEEGLRLYRLDLARQASRLLREEGIKERDWDEGEVVLRLTGLAAGAIPVISVDRSSGSLKLDDRALGMLQQAVRRTVLPPELRDRKFDLALPLYYSRGE